MKPEIAMMIEEKIRFVKGIETLLSMDKRSNVDSLAYKVEFHDESEDFYDEYIDIIYRNGNYRRLFVTGYSNGANLKAVAKEVYSWIHTRDGASFVEKNSLLWPRIKRWQTTS